MHAAYWLQRSAQRTPNNALWITESRTITYREGAERVNRLAHAMLARGASKNRAAILSSNRFEGLETFLACMTSGNIPVPMNPRLHPQEYAFLLEDSGARFVFYSEDFADQVARLRTLVSGVEFWVCIGAGDDQSIGYESLLADAPADTHPNVQIDPDDVAWLFYTSGTTGKPKGAMETHRNLITMCQQFLLGIVPDVAASDVMLHVAPISHGTASCMMPHLAVGAGNAFPLSKSFSPDKVFEAIDRFRVTSTFMAPTMINMLVKSDVRHRYQLSSLKNVIYGGGPMYVEQLRQALDLLGNVFVQIYGQGEAPMTVTSLPKDEHLVGTDKQKTARLRSCGRELPAVRVAILDDHDCVLPAGQFGEVCVRSDLVMRGYWNRPDATAETLRSGWLHTGDIGFLDSDGYLFLTDRKKDLIISGGSNIYPREIEEVICEHPSVADVAVVGIPDELWGEAVKAVVVRRAGKDVSEAEIIDHCKNHLASYKKPTKIEFVAELPKNAAGKVLKRELR
ncbi:acyl-CoA synthetase [Paraburkholderia terricola]|uniref:Acyl-CoA synthetase (AMP-forming)/AMP-acid ligase II n=1 Tax=Paraburkholderia terricola TaxID=169427 RepID=A0A1M6T1L2_9BURK|nr:MULTISPECIES: long-chain fatty acid--CoA ligase [Paraburkholderia]SDO71037.1 Acyl-CoA synthetase (AMP-forming)/AMP-acid ligase II [Paraburkholderia sediminicola]SHK50811.1 Acyl-CoA synthetase (AMP-forming)/AMP-acid ligase II [Paraburkholderia terricola]